MENQNPLARIFRGAKLHRGVMTDDGAVYEQKQPIDFDKHMRGELIQGLSPVDEETRLVEFFGVDVDLHIPPKEICSAVWNKIGTEYRCVQTKRKRWRVIGWFDEPIDVEFARVKAVELEKKIESILGYKCDTGHTLPTVPREKKPGSWWFMPYHNEITLAYSPGGKPWSLEQFELSVNYRKSPLVVACIGMEPGGRHKALFTVALNKKHDKTLDIKLETLNENFGTMITEKISQSISHAEQSAEKEEYDKEYFLRNQPYYIEQSCGVKPHIDAKAFSAVTTNLSDENVYVIKRTDFWNFKVNDWFTKEQMSDTWAHYTKGPKTPTMTRQLLESEKMPKVMSYLCHAGLRPGVIQVGPREIPGVEPGSYLNIYRPYKLDATQGDTTTINFYYSWLLGEDNWNTIKQVLKFMLENPGVKIQWCIVIKGKVQGAGKGLLALLMESLFGAHNVKTNVSFNDLTRDHSTIIEGKQLIVLNELVLQGGGKEGKILSNKLKPYITDPTLWINPKGKKEIEISNFCNFFMFSNDRKPMMIDPEDRRLFVITIKKKKFEVRKKLDEEGYKKEIFKNIKNPSAFKWHLLNEVTIEDKEIFFTDAPMNKDKEQLIQDSKDDFEKKINEAYETGAFPFRSKAFSNGDTWGYGGLLHRDDLDSALKQDKSFRGTYRDLSKLDEFLDEITIEKKQVRISNGERPRIRIIKDPQQTDGIPRDYKGVKLTDKVYTESVLGSYFEKHRFKGKDEYEYHDDKQFEEELNYRANDPETLKRFEERFETVCWSCKKPIDTDSDDKCSECDFGIKCSCGECICDDPNSNVKKKR